MHASLDEYIDTLKTRVAAVGIDCHDSSRYMLKETDLAVEIDWLDESIHARKESASVIAHDYLDGLTNLSLQSVWIDALNLLHCPVYVA